MTELQAKIIKRILEDEEAMMKAAAFIKMEKEREHENIGN